MDEGRGVVWLGCGGCSVMDMMMNDKEQAFVQ